MTTREELFNWPNILQEARARHAEHIRMTSGRSDYPPEQDTMEYWCAWCAHANAIACSDGIEPEQKR